MLRIALVLAVALTLALTGCATIMHGTSQDIGISSNPSGARVFVNNMPYGNTPVIASLSRKDNHFVRIVLPGYRPFETTVTRKTSGWVWGNLAFGGLIGLGVDAIGGGMYKLTPEQVAVELRQGEGDGAKLLNDDTLLIKIAFKVDPDWVKIDQLQKN